MKSNFAELRYRFALLALSCVHREYPNKIAHVLSSDADVRSPRQLTPAFYGCFDWHSAVHGHWLLTRLARLDSNLTEQCFEALRKSLTKENLHEEMIYLSANQRQTFERPYGLAWLLQLVMELDEWTNEEQRQQQNHNEIIQWRDNLRPLETIVVERLSTWIPKLSYPVRSGEHSQTAFALGLSLDYARQMKNLAFTKLIEENALRFFLNDKIYPFHYEPSGEDFLSAGLAEADLMRRIFYNDQNQFVRWFRDYFPFNEIPLSLQPPSIVDPKDPKLIHLAGLALSRAWMLQGIVQSLPDDYHQRQLLIDLSENNAQAGLIAIDENEYGGGHWLGTFAIYYLTQRGIH